MPKFATILDGYTQNEIRAFAYGLRMQGYSLRVPRLEEYFSAAVVVSLQAVPPNGSWQYAWTFINPAGRQFAVLSDGSGIIRKMAALDGFSRDARSDGDDLAAAILVRMA